MSMGELEWKNGSKGNRMPCCASDTGTVRLERQKKRVLRTARMTSLPRFRNPRSDTMVSLTNDECGSGEDGEEIRSVAIKQSVSVPVTMTGVVSETVWSKHRQI